MLLLSSQKCIFYNLLSFLDFNVDLDLKEFTSKNLTLVADVGFNHILAFYEQQLNAGCIRKSDIKLFKNNFSFQFCKMNINIFLV